MEIIELEQGSPEWFEARLGSIGGSTISSVVAGGQGKMRKNLMYRLAGEILSGQSYEGYKNYHMDRGIEQEADARNMYELMTENELHQVGLIRHSPHKHFSPDALCGDWGLVEIKSVIPSVHVETIWSGKVPAAYRKQCQWGLFITESDWCDFVSYSPLVTQRPMWVKRVKKDEELIDTLDIAADKFIAEMLEIVEKIRG
jgi:hypothetical protein